MSDELKAPRRQITDEADQLYQAGHAKQAAALLRPCVSLFSDGEKSGDEWFRFCMVFGSSLAESGDPQLAIMMFRSAELACGTNADALASVCMNLGNTYRYVNNWQPAYDYYNRALTIFRDGKHYRGQGRVLLSLTVLFFDIGANDRAQELLSEFEKLPEGIREDPEIRWSWQMQLAKVQDAKHESPAAVETLEKGIIGRERDGRSGLHHPKQGGARPDARQDWRRTGGIGCTGLGVSSGPRREFAPVCRRRLAIRYCFGTCRPG